MVAQQVVGCARDRHAVVEQPQLELAEVLLALVIRVRDERAHDDTALHRRLQRLLELGAVEAEDHHVDRLLRLLNRGQDRGHAVVGLDDELHDRTLICPSSLFSRPTRPPFAFPRRGGGSRSTRGRCACPTGA